MLGQELLPHVQPTGLALLALAGEDANDRRIEKSLHWLETVLPYQASPVSLSFGILGLTAHGRRPEQAGHWLGSAWNQKSFLGRRPYTAALLSLAALPRAENPILQLITSGNHERAVTPA